MSIAHQQALKLIEDGLSPEDVERELIAGGTSPAQARAVVASLADYAAAQARMQASAHGEAWQGEGSGGGGADVIVGLGLLALGLVVTVVSFGAAAGGGTYVIAIGPMVVGALRLFRGLARG